MMILRERRRARGGRSRGSSWMNYALIAAGVGVAAYLFVPSFRKMINPSSAALGYSYPAFDEAAATAAGQSAIMALHDDCRAKHNILKAKYHSEKDTIGAKAAIHQYVAADQLLAKECHARHRATILQFRAQYMPAH